jgi:F420-dependent oxidoreductase-like protein
MLQVSRFPWKAEELAERLGGIAQAAEGAGFAGLAVMDHFIQIPKVGRHWEIIPEGYTTLSFLSALTRRLRLGVLVTGVTYRNLGLLGKMVATLDVLSGGRAFCGLGAAWFEREHEAYGFTFPPARQRLDILEDALQVLPLLWGPGSPPFTGKTMTMAETTCYPRPLQEKIPIIVGGGGERRTLRLAARYADACNLGGSVDVVKHKREVLGQHCREVGRDPNSIEITHLTNLRVGEMGSGTLRRHVDGFRRLREEGVTTFFVSVSDLTGTEQIEMLVPVMAALR